MENQQNTLQEQTGLQSIGPEQLRKFTQILQKYKAGKARTEQRIVASENWWKLRNTQEEQKVSQVGTNGEFASKSGWLHNVIVSKHADAMASYPEPIILPREADDKPEATKLSAIVPCILEQNCFEEVYSDVMWQKLKTGTGVYKVVWDKSKLNGLGDIAVQQVSLLNLFWEPGIKDIQKSRFFFQTELADKEQLEEEYPQLKNQLKGNTVISTQFQYDDTVSTEGKHTVIEVYYHKFVKGKKTLQYCKYVEEQLLYATENDPALAERGLYDHGMYPYVFDVLFPIEGSPCGYGFVDVCRNPQTAIDIMQTGFVENTMAGATPRYWARGDGGVNEEEFLDLSKRIVHANNIGEDALRPIEHNPLDGNYLAMLDRVIQELRETSGNTETSTGNVSSGVTAAAAIAALQEASGKGSRDSNQTSYRAFGRVTELCIENIRQFYDMPRQFRILGQYGTEQFISYSNAGLQIQHQGNDFGQDMGYRKPVFDIKVSAQKKNVYTKVTQNELALQFFQLGFFNPQMTDQTMLCLEMMEFDGKDQVMQKVVQLGTMYQKLQQYMQLAMTLAQALGDLATAQQIGMELMQMRGGQMGMATAQMPQTGRLSGAGMEPAHVQNARSRAGSVAQPGGGKVLA